MGAFPAETTESPFHPLVCDAVTGAPRGSQRTG